MSKILPLKLDLIFGGRCWDRNRLSAILAYPNTLPWFYNNFTNLYMQCNYTVTAYDTWKASEFIGVYDEIISVEYIDYTKENLIGTITEALSNGEYIIAGYDRYFFKNTDDYLKNHAYHDALIYGFDAQKKTLFYCDAGINGKHYDSAEIEYDSFLDAYFSGLKLMNQNGTHYWGFFAGLPLSKFSVNPKECKINLRKIMFDLHVQSIGYEYIWGYHPDGQPQNYWGGIKVFDGYSELLDKAELNPQLLTQDPYIIWGANYVIENKKSQHERFKYLFDNRLVMVDEEIFSDIKELLEMLSNFFNLFRKYSHNHSLKTLSECREFLPLIKKQDEKMLRRAVDIIYKSIENQWAESMD